MISLEREEQQPPAELSKAARLGIKERRRALIDQLDRQGFTATTIAEYVVKHETDLKELFPGLPDGNVTLSARVHFLTSQYINVDTKYMREWRVHTIDTNDVEAALNEYIAREDRLYAQAWRDHDLATEVRDRIAALVCARESARNKAKALGLMLDKNVPAPGNTTTIYNLGQLALLAARAPEMGGQLDDPSNSLQSRTPASLTNRTLLASPAS